ncbi:hypothetical protein NKJ26_03165 [Mesorhizobium sp. M0152]|uniref:hypothetical protein n=1 Tax=Mesorhizobium sp. M0152 TaxID=2956898 RepID=UPI00333A0477
MSLTVTFGWWVVPAVITIGTFGRAAMIPAEPKGGDYSFPDPMPFIRFGLAAIFSLAAWLVWALAA